jgi:alanine-synthesizing transaminase
MSIPSLKTRERLSEVRYEIRGELARRARELEGPGPHADQAQHRQPRAPSASARRNTCSARSPTTSPAPIPTRTSRACPRRARRSPRHKPARHAQCVARARVRRQRRERADRPEPARAAQPGRRSAAALARLSAVVGGDHPQRRRPVYYRCSPENGFLPDPDEIASLVSPRTRAIVLINPNNPTGATCIRARCSNASSPSPPPPPAADVRRDLRRHPVRRRAFEPLAPLAGDLPCLSFGGLSKVHRACGWRVGWAVLSGDPRASGDFHHAMDLLGALRLCANVPGQFAIDQALHGEDTIRR